MTYKCPCDGQKNALTNRSFGIAGAVTKNVKNVSRFANIQLQNAFPMRASDSSVGSKSLS